MINIKEYGSLAIILLSTSSMSFSAELVEQQIPSSTSKSTTSVEEQKHQFTEEELKKSFEEQRKAMEQANKKVEKLLKIKHNKSKNKLR